jgi:hypothetical protein
MHADARRFFKTIKAFIRINRRSSVDKVFLLVVGQHKRSVAGSSPGTAQRIPAYD